MVEDRQRHRESFYKDNGCRDVPAGALGFRAVHRREHAGAATRIILPAEVWTTRGSELATAATWDMVASAILIGTKVDSPVRPTNAVPPQNLIGGAVQRDTRDRTSASPKMSVSA